MKYLYNYFHFCLIGSTFDRISAELMIFNRKQSILWEFSLMGVFSVPSE